MENITIGKLAKVTGVSIETIRFYEKAGLLQPRSRSLGSLYRQYDAMAIRRLQFIRKAKDLGFALKEIKDLLNLRVKNKGKCASVRAKTEEKIADVNRKIQDLEQIKQSLVQLAKTCHSDASTTECPILDFLEKENSHA